MARIAKVMIRNFRAIRSFDWSPKPGFNCLLGSGDSGKSSVLEAIAWCLSANVNRSATDADFYKLDLETPIEISLTLIDLPERLLAFEPFGPYHRGFNHDTDEVEDEPGPGLEIAFSVTLRIDWTMQGRWSLDTDRIVVEAERHAMALRMLRRLSLLQLQGDNTSQLTFGRGSVLFNLSDDQLELNGALASAARAARDAFGGAANAQLKDTLERVHQIASHLGINAAANSVASLDASQVTLRPGNVVLQDHLSIPLTRLGLGSSRLLIAGLQQEAKAGADIGLVDELESGLEPHRIVRLLQTLGAKRSDPTFQVFATTHSPVVVRELNVDQLVRVQNVDGIVKIPPMDAVSSLQGTLRSYPEAFLSTSVIVCEGAGEVGLIRGLDLHRIDKGKYSLSAYGTALVNAGGCDNILACAEAFHSLGYRVAILRDDDKQPHADHENALVAGGCLLAKWPQGYALEHAVFLGLPGSHGLAVVRHAIELYGLEAIEDQVRNQLPKGSAFDFEMSELIGVLDDAERQACAKAAMSRSKSWFKKRGIGVMETIAYEVIGPALEDCEPWMKDEISKLFEWAADA